MGQPVPSPGQCGLLTLKVGLWKEPVNDSQRDDMPTLPCQQAQSHVFVQSAGCTDTQPPHGCPPGTGPTPAWPPAPFRSGEVGSVGTSLICTGSAPLRGQGQGHLHPRSPRTPCWKRLLILDKSEDQTIKGEQTKEKKDKGLGGSGRRCVQVTSTCSLPASLTPQTPKWGRDI